MAPGADRRLALRLGWAATGVPARLAAPFEDHGFISLSLL